MEQVRYQCNKLKINKLCITCCNFEYNFTRKFYLKLKHYVPFMATLDVPKGKHETRFDLIERQKNLDFSTDKMKQEEQNSTKACIQN